MRGVFGLKIETGGPFVVVLSWGDTGGAYGAASHRTGVVADQAMKEIGLLGA